MKPCYKSHAKGKARAAIIINNDVSFWPIDLYTTPDMAAAHWS